jgi:hypothetical protein
LLPKPIDNHVLFSRKVVEEGSTGDASSISDIVNQGAMETSFKEEIHGSIDEMTP